MQVMCPVSHPRLVSLIRESSTPVHSQHPDSESHSLLWMDTILHNFEAMRKPLFVIYRSITIPGFRRWCKMDFAQLWHQQRNAPPTEPWIDSPVNTNEQRFRMASLPIAPATKPCCRHLRGLPGASCEPGGGALRAPVPLRQLPAPQLLPGMPAAGGATRARLRVAPGGLPAGGGLGPPSCLS